MVVTRDTKQQQQQPHTVKLKWLAPSGGDQANNRSGGQHELLKVRAGQQVAFECAAAAQPAPRIRWFRLVTAPVGLGAAKQPAGKRAWPTGVQATSRLDEAAIRSALLQMDALGEPTNLHKLEIGSKGK